MRPRTRAAALVAIVSIAASASAHAGAAPPVRLSDEITFTNWASPVARANARVQPSVTAHKVGHLRLLTEDGFPEVYLLLGSATDAQGTTWVRLRLPRRPNGVTGWVPRRVLGPFNLVHTRLVVNRRTLRVTLFDNDEPRFSARVGVGAPGTPTPAGSFWIREKFRVGGHTLYGPRALGTSAYSNVLTDWPGGGVIGLHGTDAPSLIPGRPSHGCIRLRNRDIDRLYALTPIGTPLLIK